MLNLIDLQPALGVIVLAGTGPKVEATKVFARSLAARHASRIEIWDESQVAALAGEVGTDPQPVADAPTAKVETSTRRSMTAGATSSRQGAGKYGALTTWLANERRARFEASFSEVEKVLGFPLPASSRRHGAHWYSYQGSAVVRAIHDAGWRAHHVDVVAERLVFERTGSRTSQ